MPTSWWFAVQCEVELKLSGGNGGKKYKTAEPSRHGKARAGAVPARAGSNLGRLPHVTAVLRPSIGFVRPVTGTLRCELKTSLS